MSSMEKHETQFTEFTMFIKYNLYGKIKFLKQADYIGYVKAKLSFMVKLAGRLPQIHFYKGFFKNKKDSALVSRPHVLHNF